jgi:hypothetical protein
MFLVVSPPLFFPPPDVFDQLLPRIGAVSTGGMKRLSYRQFLCLDWQCGEGWAIFGDERDPKLGLEGCDNGPLDLAE